MRRTCARTRCQQPPVATVGLRYEAREVVVDDLSREPDPGYLDLCREHAGRLSPPRGWSLLDVRSRAAV